MPELPKLPKSEIEKPSLQAVWVEQELIGEPISAIFGNLGSSGNFDGSIGMKAVAGL